MLNYLAQNNWDIFITLFMASYLTLIQITICQKTCKTIAESEMLPYPYICPSKRRDM